MNIEVPGSTELIRRMSEAVSGVIVGQLLRERLNRDFAEYQGGRIGLAAAEIALTAFCEASGVDPAECVDAFERAVRGTGSEMGVELPKLESAA